MDFVHLFVAQYPFIVYPVVSLGVVVEMNVTLLVSGFLVHEQALSSFWVFIFGTAGSIVHDVLFWMLGKKLSATQISEKFVRGKKLQGLLGRMHPMMGKFVFFSKFVWNFNRIVLLSSGYLKMNFWKFLRSTSLASALWTLVLLFIGSTVANETQLFEQRLGYVGLIVGGTIGCVMLIQWAVRHFILRKLFILAPDSDHL